MGKGTDQVEFAQRLGKRPAPECVSVGDTVECDLREPYPHVSRWRLLTPEAAAYATTLLATPGSGWRKTPNVGIDRLAVGESESNDGLGPF